MPYTFNIVKQLASTPADVANLVINEATTNWGWSIYDDMRSSSYIVLKKQNINGVNGYWYISWDSSKLYYVPYRYWNNSTHSGAGYNYYSIYVSASNVYVWLAGDEKVNFIMTLSGSSYGMLGFLMGDPFYKSPVTKLTSNATTGNNVTINVQSTEGFIPGYRYSIIDSITSANQHLVTVTQILNSTQMVVDTLSFAYPAGSTIGLTPMFCGIHSNYASTSPIFNAFALMLTGTNSNTSCNYYYSYKSAIPLSLTDYSLYFNNANLRLLAPWMSYHGYNNYYPEFIYDGPIVMTPGCNPEDVFYLSPSAPNKVYYVASTSTGNNGLNILNDTTKTWTTDQWKDKFVVISSGPGVGQIRKIQSNTATTLTLYNNWSTLPDSTSQYVIVDEAYLGLQYNFAAKWTL